MSALPLRDANLGVGTPNSQFYLVYASRISPKYAFTRKVFTDICHTSQRHNQATGITGFLFFKRGKFLQYLEGSEANVRALFQTISEDPRNKNLKILAEGYHDTRLFSDWAMHCFELDHDDQSHEVGECFETYDVMHWDEAVTQQAIGEVKSFYQRSNLPVHHHYQPREASYMGEWVVSIRQQHATFIMLQLVFIIVAFMMMGYFMLVH